MKYVQRIVYIGGLVTILGSTTPCEVREADCGYGASDLEIGATRRVTVLETRTEKASTCAWSIEAGDTLEFSLVDIIEKTEDNGCLANRSCDLDVWDLRSDIGLPVASERYTFASGTILKVLARVDPETGCGASGELHVSESALMGHHELILVVDFEWDNAQSTACQALGLVRMDAESSPVPADISDKSPASATTPFVVNSAEPRPTPMTSAREDTTSCSRVYTVKLDPPLSED